MTVRFAREADIPRILVMLRQIAEVHHEARPDLFRSGIRKFDDAALRRMLADPTRVIFAGELDGEVAGYAVCMLQQYTGDPVRCDRKTLYIDDLCVDEPSRGSGLAKAIFDRAVEYARSIGCDDVTLNVWRGNDRAIRFYEKCGMLPQKIGMELIL